MATRPAVVKHLMSTDARDSGDTQPRLVIRVHAEWSLRAGNGNRNRMTAWKAPNSKFLNCVNAAQVIFLASVSDRDLPRFAVLTGT